MINKQMKRRINRNFKHKPVVTGIKYDPEDYIYFLNGFTVIFKLLWFIPIPGTFFECQFRRTGARKIEIGGDPVGNFLSEEQYCIFNKTCERAVNKY